jgi:hypothetical protein
MKHGKRIHTSDTRIVVVGEQRMGYFAVFAIATEVFGQRGAMAENILAT